MKKIEAIIRLDKLDSVKEALATVGLFGLTVYEVRGRGAQKGIVRLFRGREFRTDLLPKVKLEVVVEDADAEKALDIIVKSARTGIIGDGKIFISNIDEVVRVRTGEKGTQALYANQVGEGA